MGGDRVLGGARAGAAAGGPVADGDVGTQPRRHPACRRAVDRHGQGDDRGVQGSGLGERPGGPPHRRQGPRTGRREGLRHPGRPAAPGQRRRRDAAGLPQHAGAAAGARSARTARRGFCRSASRGSWARPSPTVRTRGSPTSSSTPSRNLAQGQPDRSRGDRGRPDGRRRHGPPSDRAGDRRPAAADPGGHLPQSRSR